MGLDVGEIGMGLDLGLDLKLFAARSAGRMAAAAAKGAPAAVEACIRSLEEERAKIAVFQRELPLCNRLLADVIEELKEEAAKRSGGGDRAEAKADDGDKRKWMSTAQLWVDSEAKTDESEKEQHSDITSPEPKLLGGAPMPLRAVAAVPPPPPSYFSREDKAAGTVGLPLVSPAAKRPLSPGAAADERRKNLAARFAATMPPPGSGLGLQSQSHAQQHQQARKARRCWSPELHRRFVEALHQLGGSQVATPKQIREVMQVDGLTNDEVKSHLQKYRLHNRRSPGAASVTLSQPLVLVGGLFVPQEQSRSQSRSPESPLQFSGSGVGASAATAGGDSSDEDEGYSRK
ncbi:hypothetical protein ACP70R_025492 [Stipagrostis hirtigluma subsp. patula]